MELIFLDRASLKLKDHAYIGTSWELNIDMVVSQKSSFNLNAISLDTEIGDIAILKEPGLNYIGVVEAITQNNDDTIKVQLLDFKELFDMKVPATSFEGNVAEYLANLIKNAFVNNGDTRQNLTYLTIECNANVEGSILYEEDKITNIKDIIEEVTKQYNLVLKYKVGFIRGRFSSITIIIEQLGKTIKLRHDLKAISDVVITDSKQYSTNKVVFYPKSDNEEHKDICYFYLLQDGSITKDGNALNRYKYVKLDCAFYSDKDYELLESKALGLMSSSAKDHQITFSMAMDNKVFRPLSNMYLGYLLTFISQRKTYETVLTQIKFKNNFDVCYLTLGEYRNSLTDKIKLLSKKEVKSEENQATIGTTYTTTSQTKNIDGGDY